MITLRRIGVFSAGRVGFLFGLATGIVHLGIGITLFILGGGSLAEIPLELWRLLAMSIVMSSLVLAGVMTMFAFLYNISPGSGGLKLEFDMQGASITKRKNDEFIDDDIEEIE